MAEVKSFLLPDLGEGLPDAEIVEWLVPVGAEVRLDQPLVSMETAKAVVEVPSPYSGRLVKVYGQAGDVIETGKPLCDIELTAGPQRAAGHDTGHHPVAPTHAPPRTDAGTVVGSMEASDRVQREAPVELGGVRAMPAVRALAKKLGVDLSRVVATGPERSVTLEDVKRAAAAPPAAPPTPAPAVEAPSATRPPKAAVASTDTPSEGERPLRGVRRNMARVMAEAHAEVVATTIMDDADLAAWAAGQDITVRLVRAMVRACLAEPALNAWLDAKNGTLRRHGAVHLGIAVDTPEGLFVPVLRHAERLDAAAIRAELDRLRARVQDRSLPPEDLTGYTISLSNFGVFAGKYATPIVVPPCVAILAAGRLYWQAVPVMGGIAAHRMLPLSLTFDHRACTGGEAARFLKALLDDLARAD